MWSKTIKLNDIHEISAYKNYKVEQFSSKMTNSSLFEMVPLNKIISERKEFVSPQENPDKRYNYLGLENITSHTGELVNFIPKKGALIRSRSKIFYKGDILFGKLRPNLNKVFLVEEPLESGICSAEFIVIQPNEDFIFPNYLRYILSSSYIQDFVQGLQTGAALPRLQVNDLVKIKIPLPPKYIQLQYEELIKDANHEYNQIKQRLKEIPQDVSNSINSSLSTGEPLKLPDK